MPKFRVKPAVVFDAVQFSPNESAPSANLPAGVQYDGLDYTKVPHWSIQTPVGHFRVTPGDYVLVDAAGSTVTTKADFEANYEAVV